ncbi:MAG: phage portal protein [Asticcacaulis sp.]
MTDTTETDLNSGVECFTFGGDESVLDGPRFMQFIETWHNNQWYEPPVQPKNLSRLLNVTPHHRSAIALKVNILCETYIEHPLLPVDEFEKFALDYIVQANAYLERVDAVSGRPMGLRHALAQQVRKGLMAGQFYFLGDDGEAHEFRRGAVFHLKQNDVAQEIYGLPEYLAALQSALLNEAATLFRRRYYINGAHAGFLMYVSTSGMHNTDVDALRDAVKKSRGVGNFKNMFMHIPGGSDKGVQIIPISEVAAKDEFFNIKNITRDDVLAAHRTPPQMMGVIPANAGGFGDVTKADAVFYAREIKPIQRKLMGLNRWLGQDVIRFEDYTPVGGTPASG